MGSPNTASPQPEEKRVWDLGIRLFHWTLVGLVAASFYLGHFGPNIMTAHFYIGYAVIGLVAFRIVWGLVGPRTARFWSFLYGPGAVLRYMATLGQRKPSHWDGHNPMGGLSVFALLGLLMIQIGTGLISDPEDFVNVGPLADQVPSEIALKAPYWHSLSGWALAGLIALHIAVILFYKVWKRENLVQPMVTGRKKVLSRH